MTKERDALKLALEALEYISSHYMSLPKIGCMALAALEEALADSALDRMAENARELGLDYETAQQQEPVAWYDAEKDCAYTLADCEGRAQDDLEPLYLAPASKQWVGLTQEERDYIWNTVGNSDAHGDVDGWSGRYVMDAIEAKLREKNA